MTTVSPDKDEPNVRNMQQSSDMVERVGDCPHAAPFRYCETCKVEPCPVGLGENADLNLQDRIAIKLGYHRMIGSSYGVTTRAVLEASHHAELVGALAPFAAAGRQLRHRTEFDDKVIVCVGEACLTFGDFQRANVLLAKIGGEQ